MPKHFSQLLTVFALLIFAAQSLASSGVVCVMLTGGDNSTVVLPVESSSSMAAGHCHDAPAQEPQTVDNTSTPTAKGCFYCSHKLCGNGAFSAYFATQGLQLPALIIQTYKPAAHTPVFASAPRSPLYRPPISA